MLLLGVAGRSCTQAKIHNLMDFSCRRERPAARMYAIRRRLFIAGGGGRVLVPWGCVTPRALPQTLDTGVAKVERNYPPMEM